MRPNRKDLTEISDALTRLASEQGRQERLANERSTKAEFDHEQFRADYAKALAQAGRDEMLKRLMEKHDDQH